jgi:hypothetical protein
VGFLRRIEGGLLDSPHAADFAAARLFADGEGQAPKLSPAHLKLVALLDQVPERVVVVASIGHLDDRRLFSFDEARKCGGGLPGHAHAWEWGVEGVGEQSE